MLYFVVLSLPRYPCYWYPYGSLPTAGLLGASLRQHAVQVVNLLLVKTPWKVDAELDMQVAKLAREIMHRHALSLKLAHLAVVHDGAKSVDLDLVKYDYSTRTQPQAKAAR